MGMRLVEAQMAALVESLTERELEVLRLLAARHLNAGIAAELVVKRCTVSLPHPCVQQAERPQPHPGGARARALRLLDRDPAAGSTSALHPLVDAPRPPRRKADDQTVTRPRRS